MTSSERVETETPEGQAKPNEPIPQCCGGDFGAVAWKGGATCSPEGFLEGMARFASEDTTEGAACPISKTCGGMMKGRLRGLGLLLLIPAGVLLTLGAAILFLPQILAWLVAGGLILAGGLVLVAAYRIGRPGRPAA